MSKKNSENRCKLVPRVSAGRPGLRAELETAGFVFDIKRYAIHDGPGIRTTVFFKGCPLQCRWCHNPESWQSVPQPALRTNRCIRCGQCVQLCRQNAVSLDGDLPRTDPKKCTLCGECIEPCPGGAREIIGSQRTVAEVMAEIEKDTVFYDESGGPQGPAARRDLRGGATFSGGEPLAQPEFLLALLNQCRARGIHTAVDTCCYAQADVVDAVAEKADLFLCDIKHMNSEKHRQFTGVENALILDNIKRLCETGSLVVIRIPIIPGVNDDAENISATGRFAASLPGVERIDILPYNRGGNEKARRFGTTIDLIQVETPNDQKMNSIADHLGSYGFRVKIGG